MFLNCNKLIQLDLSNWNTKKITDIYQTFRNCSSLTRLDLSNWDTKNVYEVYEAFGNCPNLYKIKIFNKQTALKLINYLPTRKSVGYIFTKFDIPNEKNWISYICEDYKTTFKLPRPLRSVGDIADRLYWDYNKGHYCIEKNVNENYTKLDTPTIIDLPIKNKISMIYETNTRINTNTIKTQIQLSSPIFKIKPSILKPNQIYTLRFICFNAENVIIDLGGKIIETNSIENKVDIQLQTLETLTNEYISIYGNGGTITDVMLFEGTDIGEVGYIDNTMSVGKLQEDGSYKIILMTSPHILKGGK